MKIATATLLIVCLIVLGAPCSQVTLGSSLSLDLYWQRVGELQALVTGLEDLPAEDVHEQLLTAADQWQDITEVVLSDGTRVPLDHSFLLAQLRADPPNVAQLKGLLSSLLAVRDDWTQQGQPPADMAALQRILARPEFQWSSEEPSPLAEWWQRLLERLGRLFPSLGSGAPLLRYVLTGLGLAALAVALAYILRNLLDSLVTERDLLPEVATADEDLTAATALTRAQVLAKGKDYRSAVRYLYLSSLLLLEERGLLRYDRSLTNREYLRSVAQFPQLEGILRQVVDVFERVWYGYQPLDEAAYSHYAARVDDLHRLK